MYNFNNHKLYPFLIKRISYCIPSFSKKWLLEGMFAFQSSCFSEGVLEELTPADCLKQT